MTTDPPGPLRRDDARAMWREYAAASGVPAEEEPAVERFGDSAALADELIGLVLAGTKRATAGLVADFAADGEPLPRIGGHWIACDGAGVPRCVLRSVDLRLGPLASATTRSPGTRARATAPARAGWRGTSATSAGPRPPVGRSGTTTPRWCSSASASCGPPR
jgi:hypothetical protein